MIASVHLADVGARSTFAMTRKAPPTGSIKGLRNAEAGIAAPLRGAFLPSPQFGRAAFVGFWDDDDALDEFLDGHPLAAKFASGFHVRLAPLRASGTWPGLPSDVPSPRNVTHDGPVAALTLGRLRTSQAIRFLRASARAEASVVKAPGLTWATGIAHVPTVVSTFSLWESTRALSTFAYGNSDPVHPEAITEGDAKPFHHQSTFIRFRPYAPHGQLSGKNPLAETWTQAAGGPPS